MLTDKERSALERVHSAALTDGHAWAHPDVREVCRALRRVLGWEAAYERCLACGLPTSLPCGGLDGKGMGCTNVHPMRACDNTKATPKGVWTHTAETYSSPEPWVEP